ncbi:MAG: hypothetical protein ACLFUE_00310 [Desulfobacteraceae bacterium]
MSGVRNTEAGRWFPHQFYGRETAERAYASAESIVASVETFYSERAEADIPAPDSDPM